MPAYAPELRSFRVATYVVFLTFTLFFIGSIIRSVWVDLYGRRPSAGAMTHLTPAACRDEIESLNASLESRLSTPLTPRAERDWEKFKKDWEAFTRQFEDRIRRVQAECVAASTGDTATAAAISESVEHLDALRQHLARCGAEGEAEREAVNVSLRKLRDSVQPTHP